MIRRIFLGGLLFSYLFGFKFVVLGDRTPQETEKGLRKSAFETALEEIKVIKPDFIVHLGNLIRGHIKDTVRLKREWNYILNTFSQLGIPYHICPGSEDIWDEKSEEIYLRYFHKTYSSFQYENCHFVLLDFSRFPKYSDVPKEMIDWLRDDLSSHRRARFTFIFFHRPYWRQLKEKWGLHKVFRDYGVDYVFSGADCFYTYHFMDSIHYFSVGPTGAKFKWETDEERGAFPNYLLVEVTKKGVNLLVIKPGSILPKEVVTLKEIEERERLEKEDIVISEFSLAEDTVAVSIANPFSYELKGEIRWLTNSWEISPLRAKFYLAPQGKGYFSFRVKFNELNLFPLPELIFTYPKEESGEQVITKRLKIKREVKIGKVNLPPMIDGELREFKDSILSFGNEKGERSNLKSVLFLGYDTNHLYFGMRNYEREIKARVRERDGEIKEDDYISLLLSPAPDTIYEISLNPLGFLFDVRYVKEKGRYRKREWDGRYELKTKVGENYWQLEMAIPLQKLGLKGKERIGFNLFRYSPEDTASLTLQPPFSPEAKNLGTLILKE